MISLSVKEGKVVDHYRVMSTDFGSLWTSEQFKMGPGSQSHALSSSIDEYEPPEEGYDDEDDDVEGEEKDDDLDEDQHHEIHGGSPSRNNPSRMGVELHQDNIHGPEGSTKVGNGKGTVRSAHSSTANSGSSSGPGVESARNNGGGNSNGGNLQSSSPGSGSSSWNGHRHDHDHSENGSDDLIPKNFNFIRLIKKLANVTRDTGQNIRFECEAEGIPPPREIKWYKNGVRNQLKGDRFRIKHTRRKTAEGKRSAVRVVGSTLKIRKLEVLDKGFYTCEAVSQGDRNKISSTAILDVRHDADLDSGVIPDFPSAFDSFPEIGESGSIDKIDIFHHVPMMANTGGMMDITNPNAHSTPPKDGEGKCQIYKGTVCKHFIYNRMIYVHSEESQVIMESKLKEALNFIQHSKDISSRCSEHVMPSLCISAFPICHDNPTSEASPAKRLCREECEILEGNLCRQEFAIAKQHPVIGQQVPIPKCDELPSVGSMEAEHCVRMGLPQMIPLIDDDHTCFVGKGEDYRGNVKETVKGEQCRPWHHQINFKSTNYPELMGGHNFCRNRGGLEEQPWCFSSSDHYKRVPCKVQRCDVFGNANKIWVPISGGIAAFLLTLLIICMMCRCRKSRNKSKPSGTKSIASLEMNSLNKRTSHTLPKTLEVPIGNIQFLQELGEGAYGKVYKGEAFLCLGEPSVLVAIKTLKTSAAQKTHQDFIRESELMAQLKHPNIVCVLGVVTKGEPRCILFEYLPHGDLHEYLISHSSRNTDYGGHKSLEQNEMLFIATQIAAGMEYLAAHHYVHRDLATRNAMVGECLTVKISDFGPSREIYSSDYYLAPSKSLVPLRWMPPESILHGQFSTESDVWAFGVVLWEIYSYGLQPYDGYSNPQVIDMIRSRQLLHSPDQCPSSIYALMMECWAEIPHRRPSFEELHSRLKQWLLPLLGPNSTFSQHLNCPGVAPGSLSCTSHNSMSSHHSSNTSPLASNNTNSTNISQFTRTAQQSPSQCVAYQTTSIIPCSMAINGGRFSPQQTLHTFQVPSSNTYANFTGSTGNQKVIPSNGYSHIHPMNGYPQSIGSNSSHSYSHYKVLMESKATNI